MMEKRDEVLAKLAEVYDPELDQSVTEMGFIEDVHMDNSAVTIFFRLPTYWCSPNFAYIMAEDMRDRVLELPWVEKVVISLKDHCAAEQVNQGVSSGKSFLDTFSDLSGGNLQDLRQTFRVKTFVSRQEYVLRHLLAAGMTAPALSEMSLGDAQALLQIDEKGKRLMERYLIIRKQLGLNNGANEKAFTHPNGDAIAPDEFSAYLLDARRTRMSMEFNANHCRGLLETRYAVKVGNE